MRDLLQGFRAFIMRGNVVELAVAVVVGTAFTAVVNAVVADIFTPLIAAIFGAHDFSALAFRINGSMFRYGAFVNALITFFSVAAVIYFVVVAPLNSLAARRTRAVVTQASTTCPCPYCLTEVPLAASRCAACTPEIEPVAT